MRLHLVALAHTQTTAAYSHCAFTTLARQMATMMTRLGHEVFLYASEDDDSEASLVTCIKKREQARLCGVSSPSEVLNATWDPTAPHWAVFSSRVIDELEKRVKADDLILLSAGWSLEAVIDAFPNHLKCEYAVGYTGHSDKTHRVYPSNAWMHAVYGKWYGCHGTRGRFFDRVIPHWVDEAEFHGAKIATRDKPYFLFIGRLNEDKGVGIALETSQRLGARLVVAGQGPYALPPEIERVGLVGPKVRASLMADAVAVFAPSLYLEPFGLVAVEAQMSGTPVITTDWGAFPETVEHGVTGWRCHLAREFKDAGRLALDGALDRKVIRRRAMDRFSMAAIGPRYESYFQELLDLRGDGWYAPHMTSRRRRKGSAK